MTAIVSFFNLSFMLQEKAGELAGKIWQVLNENGQLAGKDLKKATKAKNEKDLYVPFFPFSSESGLMRL